MQDYIIPVNYDGGWVTGNGKGIEHLVEAIIAAAIIIIPVLMIHIPIKYKFFIIVLCGAPAFIVTFFGKNGCLLSEYFMDYMKFKCGAKVIEAKEPFSQS